MGVLINNFIKKGKSVASTAATATSNNVFASLNGSLIKFRDSLAQAQPQYDSLAMAFTIDPSLIADDMLSQSRVKIGEGADFVTIPDDVATDFIGGVSDAITNGGLDDDEIGITVTDAKGHFYNIVKPVGDVIVDGNRRVLLSMTNQVSDISEAIIYMDLGDQTYHFNNIIRSGDFVKAGAVIVPTNTIFDRIKTLCFINHVPISGSIATNLQAVLLKLEISFNEEDTIEDLVGYLAIHYNVQQQSTIAESLALVEEAAIAGYPQVLTSGVYTSVWSMMSDFIEASMLNTAILEVLNGMLNIGNLSLDFINSIKDKINNGYKSVSTFIDNCKVAFQKGGFYALGEYILSYAKAASSLTNDDGLLSFNDNTALVPQQYIAGMVGKIITTAVTVIGVIVSIFFKIIGAVVFSIGTVLQGIVNSISYDAQGRYAAAVLTENVRLPMSPHAFYQTKCATSVLGPSVLSLFESGAELVYIEVPGGFLIIGPGLSNPNSVKTDSFQTRFPGCTIRFHPSIIPHSSGSDLLGPEFVIKNAASEGFLSANVPETMITGDDVTFQVHISKISDWYRSRPDFPTPEEAYISCGQSLDMQTDDSGYFDQSTDANILNNILHNLAWFYLWICYRDTRYAEYSTQTLYVRGVNNGVVTIEYADPEQEKSLLALCLHFIYEATGSRLIEIVNSTTDANPRSVQINDRLESSDLTWVFLGELSVKWATPSTPTTYNSCLYTSIIAASNKYNCDVPHDLPSTLDYAIKVPKYDSTTWIKWIIVSAFATAALAIVTVVATLKVKKAINMKRARNQAAVEAAWTKLTDEPSAENYNEYRKTVKRNNRWATFIGGTKYDLVNYWNGDVREQSDDPENSVSSGLFTSFESDPNSAAELSEQNDNINTNNIIKLIAG